ncbi:MBL fold metallo-hydrolase [Pseudoalteromonas sp. TAB23]|uniref:MBL fold metallo-hydrolase n=1 Tax=Pseudoalteromonas sp. TAB23 TaxID=1938595 RepID=UPI00041C95F5|nr:MBL fold metallo-hydrolase [Pseudoalteromonas sp. TAB23]
MRIILRNIATLLAVVFLFTPYLYAGQANNSITILYDAFGKPSEMKKDWGFSAYIEYGGKRILFDTGNNAEIFAHNVKTKGVDLAKLDFAIASHRHGDHTSGLNHLVRVNPNVKIYAPKEKFGVFGAALPGTFYKRDESLPKEMRYYDGNPPKTMSFGSAWPEGNFSWVTKTTEVEPGFHLIMMKGPWGVDLDVMEISLAIDTPDGIVLIVGCSHPKLEKIIEAAQIAIGKPIHLLLGGTHLLPLNPEQAKNIATSLRDKWNVAWMAPTHCTGEPAFAALKSSFGDRYLYAGLGTTLKLGKTIHAKTETKHLSMQTTTDEVDLQHYRALMKGGHDSH